MKNVLLLIIIFLATNCFSQKSPQIHEWDPQKGKTQQIEISTAEFQVKILRDIILFEGNKENKVDSGQVVKLVIKSLSSVEIIFPNSISINKNINDKRFNISTQDGNTKLTFKLSETLIKALDTGSNPELNQEDRVLKGVKLFSNDSYLNSFSNPNYKGKNGSLISTEDYNNDFYCDKMDRCNAMLVLDGSSFLSAHSKLYRKASNGNCKRGDCFTGCRQTLKVGDYLKVYIENFNADLYDIEFISNQLDFKYGNNYPFMTKLPPEKDKVAEAANLPSDSEVIKQLKFYVETTFKLKQFLTLMRNNKFPDSELLNENKQKIFHNVIDSLRLDPNIDIDALYQLLSKVEQDKPENKLYLNNAKQFGVTFFEVMNLSYTYEITGLPIQVQSYDQLSLTIRLKDKKSGKIIREQEYLYLIRGGLKVDQSFGIAFHNIRDKQFSLRDGIGLDTTYALKSNGERIKVKVSPDVYKDSISSIKEIPVKTIEKGDSSNFKSIGLTTLTHFYYRFTGQLTIGPEIGVSVDFYPKTNIRYLFGVGLLFMDGRNRISLDGGWAMGKYTDFGSGLDYGSKINGANSSPSLIDKFGSSYFFGISYNIPIGQDNTQVEKR